MYMYTTRMHTIISKLNTTHIFSASSQQQACLSTSQQWCRSLTKLQMHDQRRTTSHPSRRGSRRRRMKPWCSDISSLQR